MIMLDVTDSSSEKVISLAEAAEILPRKPGGKKISTRSLERWIKHGHRGVYLEGSKLGRTYFTTREAIQRFSERCSQLDAKLPASAAAPQKQVKPLRATRELEKAGWAGKPKHRRMKSA